jgi:hypothetical protein
MILNSRQFALNIHLFQWKKDMLLARRPAPRSLVLAPMRYHRTYQRLRAIRL